MDRVREVDVAWLESLLALVEFRSFTRAAESLHVSQPAFSRRIRALEQWAGAELVDRSTFPVTLTEAGMKLRPWAAELVAGLDSLRDQIRGSQLMPAEAVRIAISHTLATHYFASWWKAVTSEARDLTCVLLPSNTLDAYDALLHGGCEILMAYADPVHPLYPGDSEVESIGIAEDWLKPYARAYEGRPVFELPGSARDPVPFVSHGSGAFLGRVTDRILSEEHPHLRPVVQSDLTAALAELVFAGAGIGWLPGLLGGKAAASGLVVPLPGSAWEARLEVRLFRNRRRNAGGRAELLWRRAAELAGGT